MSLKLSGTDGCHPAPAGRVVFQMAYAQLKMTETSDDKGLDVSPEDMLSRLRATCAIAIAAHREATGSRQLEILMVVYRLQDHIGLTRIRGDAFDQGADENAWVDRWRPE
jgi:hypothetical protein